MPRTVALPDDLYNQLAALAQPFIDREASDVIRRLVDFYISHAPALAGRVGSGKADPETAPIPFSTRTPRERGVKVQLDSQVIAADSVRDLYDQVLRILIKSGSIDRIRAAVPYKTSPKRYLIAERPVHPNGNPFVIPVSQRGLYMEAHKDYKNALAQLTRFLSKFGMTLRYLG